MIDTIEELQTVNKIYVLDTTVYRAKGLNYAVYKVVKTEQRGIGKWFVQLKTSARNKSFHSTINVVVRYSLTLPNKQLAFSNFEEMEKEFCKIVKKSSDKNPALAKKLAAKYPQYFI